MSFSSETEWMLRFVRFLFPYDTRRIRAEEAFDLKEKHIPSKLYKYRSFSESHIDALLKGVLYQSAPIFFNDPYDSFTYFEARRMMVEDLTMVTPEEKAELFQQAAADPAAAARRPLTNPISREALRAKMIAALGDATSTEKQALEEALTEVDSQMQEEFVIKSADFLRKNYSVLSLTENPFSVLMWSHYSSNHTGFCIEYDMAPIDYHLKFLRRICFPVYYRKKLLDISRYFFGQNPTNFNNLVGLFTCILKSNEWAYEREWRFVLPVGEAHANKPMNMPIPSALIMGVSISKENEERLRAIADEQGIPLKRMHQRYNAFRLDVRDA